MSYDIRLDYNRSYHNYICNVLGVHIHDVYIKSYDIILCYTIYYILLYHAISLLLSSTEDLYQVKPKNSGQTDQPVS